MFFQLRALGTRSDSRKHIVFSADRGMNACYSQVLGALVRYQLKHSSTLSQAFKSCLVSCLCLAPGSVQAWVDEGSMLLSI